MQHVSIAAEPTVTELISLAPAFSSDDPRCRSIEIEVCFSQEFATQHAPLTFRAIYRAPDQFALFVIDGTDGTPLFGLADKRAFLYDPVRPVVFYMTGVKPIFEIAYKDDRLKFGYAFTNEDAPAKVSGDIKSLFPLPTKDNSLLETAGDKHRLTITSQRGNPLVAIFEASKPPTCSKVEIFIRGEERPIFAVNKMAINSELRDEDFALPSKEQLSRFVSVQELEGDLSKHLSEDSGEIMRASYVRLAASHPELRDQIKGVDWIDVRLNDKTISKALRDVIANRAERH